MARHLFLTNALLALSLGVPHNQQQDVAAAHVGKKRLSPRRVNELEREEEFSDNVAIFKENIDKHLIGVEAKAKEYKKQSEAN
jgi:hypothetical protein